MLKSQARLMLLTEFLSMDSSFRWDLLFKNFLYASRNTFYRSRKTYMEVKIQYMEEISHNTKYVFKHLFVINKNIHKFCRTSWSAYSSYFPGSKMKISFLQIYCFYLCLRGLVKKKLLFFPKRSNIILSYFTGWKGHIAWWVRENFLSIW